MHKPDQIKLQFDRSQLPYSEYSSPILQEAAQPTLTTKRPTTRSICVNSHLSTSYLSHFLLNSRRQVNTPKWLFEKKTPRPHQNHLLLSPNSITLLFEIPSIFSSKFSIPSQITPTKHTNLKYYYLLLFFFFYTINH